MIYYTNDRNPEVPINPLSHPHEVCMLEGFILRFNRWTKMENTIIIDTAEEDIPGIALVRFRQRMPREALPIGPKKVANARMNKRSKFFAKLLKFWR
jgi:hypothetical protein